MSEQIEDILTRGNPWNAGQDAALSAAIAETARGARTAALRPRKRRLVWAVPVVAVGALALTAGAVAASDTLTRENLVIPIVYTTDTGAQVSCTATITGGSIFTPYRDEVIDYYRTHDFSEVGQRIHDYAVVLTGEHDLTPGVLPVSLEWVPAEGEEYTASEAFSYSLASFLLTDIQVDLGISGSGGAELVSDCTGQLQ